MCVCVQESLLRQQWLNSYEAENGGSAVYGVNKFSDLTPLEFDGTSNTISITTAELNVDSNIYHYRDVSEWVEEE